MKFRRIVGIVAAMVFATNLYANENPAVNECPQPWSSYVEIAKTALKEWGEDRTLHVLFGGPDAEVYDCLQEITSDKYLRVAKFWARKFHSDFPEKFSSEDETILPDFVCGTSLGLWPGLEKNIITVLLPYDDKTLNSAHCRAKLSSLKQNVIRMLDEDAERKKLH